MDDHAPPPENAFEELLRLAREGSQPAKQKLLEKYSRAILAAIRAKMDRRLPTLWDSTDFMQRACLKLHRVQMEDKHFENEKAFMGYLVTIATREVQQEKRKQIRRA